MNIIIRFLVPPSETVAKHDNTVKLSCCCEASWATEKKMYTVEKFVKYIKNVVTISL